jgi:hypothetical protein
MSERAAVAAAAAADDMAVAAKVEKELGNHLKILNNLKEAGVDGWSYQMKMIAHMAE